MPRSKGLLNEVVFPAETEINVLVGFDSEGDDPANGQIIRQGSTPRMSVSVTQGGATLAALDGWTMEVKFERYKARVSVTGEKASMDPHSFKLVAGGKDLAVTRSGANFRFDIPADFWPDEIPPAVDESVVAVYMRLADPQGRARVKPFVFIVRRAPSF